MLPGDRRSGCRGEMKAISVYVQPKSREWSIIHQCTRCRTLKINRIAGDDNEMMLLTLAAEPIMNLPFPASDAISRLREVSLDKQYGEN
jgi:hypothetical protein